jgi:hypothetical protein
VSSASLLHDIPEKCASYNLFTIEEAGDGWNISMLTRRLQAGGDFDETHQKLIAPS